MTRYMVIHEMNKDSEEHTHPPTRLRDLARELGKDGSQPRWLATFSPDLNDDRVVSLWDASNAEQVRKAIEEYGFLDHLTPKVFAVREWGPADVLAAGDED
ncbi:MAG TPA: hypothetical protein VGR22_05760 [Thermomicrobiales bacterium]|nr:hypothetical protein [Thermomicrobiales bacterium]